MSEEEKKRLKEYQKNYCGAKKSHKDHYENDKERLRTQARDKCRNLSEEEKILKKEYRKNRYLNMSEEEKKRLKEYQKIYHEAKKSQYIIIK